MKTNDQKGFSIVEVLLTVVAVGLVGFVGWFVYHSGQAANKDYASTSSSTVPTYNKKAASNKLSTTKSGASNSSQSTNEQSVSPETLSSTTVKSGLYAGWKSAKLAYEKISFDYPADWTVEDQSQSFPKNLNGCTYPGTDEIYLTSPTKEQVFLKTGIDCIGDGGVKAFGAVPISALGQNLYLAFEDGTVSGTTPTSPSFACLAKTTNPDTPFDFSSKNIFEATSTPGSTPLNQFCYYPYEFYSYAKGDTSQSESVSSIKSSKDFATAQKIIESMKY